MRQVAPLMEGRYYRPYYFLRSLVLIASIADWQLLSDKVV